MLRKVDHLLSLRLLFMPLDRLETRPYRRSDASDSQRKSGSVHGIYEKRGHRKEVVNLEMMATSRKANPGPCEGLRYALLGYLDLVVFAGREYIQGQQASDKLFL